MLQCAVQSSLQGTSFYIFVASNSRAEALAVEFEGSFLLLQVGDVGRSLFLRLRVLWHLKERNWVDSGRLTPGGRKEEVTARQRIPSGWQEVESPTTLTIDNYILSIPPSDGYVQSRRSKLVKTDVRSWRW